MKNAICTLSIILLLLTALATPAYMVDWQKLMLSPGRSNDYYGTSVAISGKYAVVGAPGRDTIFPQWESIGGAYLYERIDGEWVQRQYLLGSELDGGDVFGTEVAIDGDTIVVGAHYDDIAGAPSGSAFVVIRSVDNWYEQAKLLRTPEPGQDHWFGWSVAISGETIVVGSQMEDNGIGSAYVFTRTGGVWTQQARLKPSDGQVDDRFGRNVAIDGDTIIVASIFDDETVDRQGSAYIFTRSGTAWTQKAKLVSGPPVTCAEFGESVSISGDTAVVGCPYDTADGVINRGAAYVFERNGATWPLKQKLIAIGAVQWDRFGHGVSIDGTNLLVGALGGSSNGYACLFRRRGGTWAQESQFFPLDPAGSPLFGESVSISGGNLVVGARGDDIASNQDQGSASAFVVPATNVLVGGRVLDRDGHGVRSTIVTMADGRGDTRYAVTNPFGYYRFNNVGTSSEYTFAVQSKRFSYTSRTVAIYGELTNLDFTPEP